MRGRGDPAPRGVGPTLRPGLWPPSAVCSGEGLLPKREEPTARLAGGFLGPLRRPRMTALLLRAGWALAADVRGDGGRGLCDTGISQSAARALAGGSTWFRDSPHTDPSFSCLFRHPWPQRMNPVTSREKEMYNLTPHAATSPDRYAPQHDTRHEETEGAEASRHGGVERGVVARVPDTRALCGGLALWGRAWTRSAGVRGLATASPACGAARPLPSLRHARGRSTGCPSAPQEAQAGGRQDRSGIRTDGGERPSTARPGLHR